MQSSANIVAQGNKKYQYSWSEIDDIRCLSLDSLDSDSDSRICILDQEFVVSVLDFNDTPQLELVTLTKSRKAFDAITLTGDKETLQELTAQIETNFKTSGNSEERNIAILVNPVGGKKEAPKMFKEALEPILQKAKIPFSLFETTSSTFVSEWVQEQDLQKYSEVISIGGDGLLGQYLNAIHQRSDWETLIRIPIGVLPGGTGNAMSSTSDCWNAFIATAHIVRRRSYKADLMAVTLDDSRYVASCAVMWGVLQNMVTKADDQFRMFGTARYTVGVFHYLLFGGNDQRTQVKYGVTKPDGKSEEIEIEEDIGSLSVCNNPCASTRLKAMMSTQSRINDGKLTLVFEKFSGRLSSMKFLREMREWQHLERDDATQVVVDWVEITPRSVRRFGIDGEREEGSNLRVDPLPGQMEVYGEACCSQQIADRYDELGIKVKAI